ncbi:chitin elicitor receptor kinase 1 [Amborella trichopoda]|uniref:chitin elicitor receptor kinase 1 n=1 Tax=Amborella trichopoda TaxID=13333 RepID=UPI0009C062B6|nr:chitin elicitor receptor kinase 1 [Amborella trichopoda]|eukprot:XP_020527577.1 chitin elicitor receptor kinase 1 [Amborella trichopoda]
MNSLWFFIWVLNLGALRLISAQQSYDETGCDDVPFEPGSKYTCNTLMKSCQTYAVYRAQQNYQTISAISLLFDLNENDILQLNNITEPLQTLDAGREVLIPVICSCSVKHPLLSYRLEELKVATGDFGEASKIGKLVYRGRLNSSKVAIKQMGSREVRSVINILTKINHVNLARLLGVCYGRSEQNPTFLVFEFAERGSLRDQLSKYSRSFELEWGKRMRIAFDMAIGLHYIHHCITPSYVHMDISSENVLVTSDWRAKIANFKHAKRVTATEDGYSSTEIGGLVMCRKGCMAPELLRGMVSPKVDVFAFGVVLLELISARETTGEMLLRDSVGFLRGGESEEGCTEKLRSFMDPSLKGDYPVNEALFLALLAKACTEEDPFHRPTMNDIVKALSKMI